MSGESVVIETCLSDLITKWRNKAAEGKEHHDMAKSPSRQWLPRHSERTIATLRQCADELEAVLQLHGFMP